MFTVYKFNLERGRVEPVKCEKVGYPNKDEHGEIMYFNTHFESPDEARASLEKNLLAWMELDRKELLRLSERQKGLKGNIRRIKGMLDRLKKQA